MADQSADTNAPLTQTATDTIASKFDSFFGADAAAEPEQQAENEEATPPSVEGDEADDATPQTTENAPQLEDVEYEGKTYKVDPTLKSALLRQADYSRKTEIVAEERRLVQLERQTHALEGQFRQSSAKEFQALQDAESELSRFSKVDWTQLDTDSLVRTRHAYDLVKEQRDQAKQAIAEKRTEFTGKVEKAKQELTQRGQEFLTKVIPQWGSATAKQAADHAFELGFTQVEMENVYDPRFVRALYEASLYAKLQATKGKSLNKAADAPPVGKVGTTTPEVKAKMDRLNFRKAMKNATTNAQKTELLAQRFSKTLFR